MDNEAERWLAFQRDIVQRLESRLGHKVEVEIIGDMAWFELGMMYSDLDLLEENDEVAAEKLVDHVIQRFTNRTRKNHNDY